MLRWVGSYFEGRTQRVRVGKASSQPIDIDIGVPQGSVLGPMFFIIYVSDLNLWTEDSSIYGFADDTTASTSALTALELKERLEKDAGNIFTFMASNGLCANPTKTGLLVHRPKSTANVPILDIIVAGSTIQESVKQTLLGIEVSCDLLWGSHLKKLEDKLRSGITMIKQLKAKLPKVNMTNILQGLVISHIRYGIQLYGVIGFDQPGELKRIQVLLNSAARVVMEIRLKDRASNKTVWDMAGIMSVRHMTTQAIITTVWKTLKFQNRGLEHFWIRRDLTGSQLSTRSQTRGDLQIPGAPLSKRLLNSLQIKGTMVWNP